MFLHYLSGIYLVLLVIIYLDFRNRTVNTFLFPLLFVLIAAYSISRASVEEVILNLSVNVVLSGCILGSSLLITRRLTARPFGKLIGAGDLLFLLCISCFFRPEMYVIFFVLSNAMTLLIHWLLTKINPSKVDATIPLAGYQSIFFGVMVPFEYMQLLPDIPTLSA